MLLNIVDPEDQWCIQGDKSFNVTAASTTYIFRWTMWKKPSWMNKMEKPKKKRKKNRK